MLNWELLAQAQRMLRDDRPDAAVQSVLEYLVKRDGKQLYEEVCCELDKIQAMDELKKRPDYPKIVAGFMVERDKCLAMISELGV